MFLKTSSFFKKSQESYWNSGAHVPPINAKQHVLISVPIGVATDVRAYQYNSTALLVEWTPVPDTRENIKGVLLGYRVIIHHF